MIITIILFLPSLQHFCQWHPGKPRRACCSSYKGDMRCTGVTLVSVRVQNSSTPVWNLLEISNRLTRGWLLQGIYLNQIYSWEHVACCRSWTLSVVHLFPGPVYSGVNADVYDLYTGWSGECGMQRLSQTDDVSSGRVSGVHMCSGEKSGCCNKYGTWEQSLGVII